MKSKKKILVICSLFVVFIVVIILMNSSKSYEISYEVGDYEIDELYDKEYGFYKFSLKYDDQKYETIILSKYLKKKLITSVEVMDEDDESCILMNSSKLDTYPICIKDGEYVDYGLLENQDDDFYKRETPEDKTFDYDGIEFESDLKKKFLIWNHKGYLYAYGKEVLELNFLETESYYNNLAYVTSNYVITPNYDEKYAFTKINIINMENGKLIEWELPEEISFNSYFLGEKDGLIYLVDRKNRKEYSLDPKRKKIVRVDADDNGKVWRFGWETVSMTKLVNNDYSFEENKVYDYRIEDGYLMLKLIKTDYSIKVSDLKVDKIVDIKGDEVFYLVKDKLYCYSPKYGVISVIKYSEFNFNNVNSVFIY